MTDQRPRDPDVLGRARTPLLALITQESLDQDYVMVAQRAAREPDGAPRTARRAAVVAVIAAFGVLVTVAGIQTSQNAAVADASRESLIERIETRRAAVREAQAELAQLRERNAAAETRLLAANDDLNDVESELRALAGQAGFGAVRGEGIRIVVDNAEHAEENSMIRDSDLALLVNALWEAGAEAVTINNQRISSVSAIRNVGPVVEVNFNGLAPPYTVHAIGDRSTLASESLANTGSGLAFASLAAQFGFTYEVDNMEEIRMPAAPAQLGRLRSAVQGTSVEPGASRLEGEGTS